MNWAASSLSKDMQRRNIRKLKVNAQVTFVVYILESLANFSILVVWTFIYGMSNAGTLTMGLVWYHIILPYTFLMNTSYNKNLITDDGWKNTIRNVVVLQIKFKPDSCQNTQKNIVEEQPRKTKASIKIRQRREVHNSGDRPTSEPRAGGVSADNKRDSRQIVQADVYVISNSENDYFTLPNIPDGEPSTSKGESGMRQSQNWVDVVQRSTSETDHDSFGLQQSYRLYIGEKILSNMMDNIYSEEKYLHYFRQLIQLEETLKQEDVCLKDFKIVHLTDCQAPKRGRIIRTNPQLNDKTILDEDKPVHFCKSKNTSPQHTASHIDFVGKVSDRIDTRRNILEDFHAYCINEELYDMLLNRVLNFEENLIKD